MDFISRRALLIMLFVFASLTVAHAQTATTPAGSGTSGDPYLIASLENLYWLSQTETVWGDDAYFRQTADIDASETSGWDSGQGFSPIGTPSTPFSGTYDGDGFTITGLFIDRNSSFAGLFGYIQGGGATFTDIGLIDINISAGQYAGGLLGYAYNGSTLTITGCYTTGSITNVSGAFTTSNTGGLAGYIFSNGTISNSYSSATVTGTSSGVGGLIGAIRKVSITNSYATGNVTGTDDTGGLIGSVGYAGNNSITNSYATGNVTGTGSAIGGLVGTVEASGISESYASGNVSGASFVGGFLGFLDDDGSHSINDSYSSGHVSGNSNAGGFLGIEYNGTVTNSYWNTEVSGQNSGLGNGTTPAGLTGLTSAQMRQQASYSGFDFTNTWAISEDTTFAWLQFHEPGFLPGIGTQATGAGTSTDPYQIAILDNLYWLSQNTTVWDAWFQQTADIDASATSTWDSGAGFSPIGNTSTLFSGTYNGNGFSITGLLINRPSDDKVALFGYVGGSTFSNITLIDANITGNNTVGGLLAGVLSFSPISVSNSYVSGTVTGIGSVGGLVGSLRTGSTISASYSSATVNAFNDLGGLVGFAQGTITSSVATGPVSATLDRAGGLIGFCFGCTATNNYATGDVSADSYAGGLIGFAISSSATVATNYATGKVTGTDNSGGFLGNYSSATVTDNYWNTETSGLSSGTSGTETGMSGLTTSQMIDSASFSGWDFASDTVWTIDSGFTFPYLPNTSDHRIVVATIDSSEGWRMIGHPGDLTYSEFLEPIWTQGYEGADSESGSSNVYFYEESTQSWTVPSSASDYFGSADSTTENTALNGILLYVYADDDADGNDDTWPKYLLSENSNLSKSYDVSLSYTDNVSDDSTGWNMVSNPYPVSLDWTEVVTNGDITNTFPVAYIWDHTLDEGNGSYKIIFGYDLPPGLDQDYLTNDPIPAMQSYWVKASESGATLSIKPDYQAGNQKLYKSTQNVSIKELPWLSLSISHAGFSDQFTIFGKGEESIEVNIPKLATIASRYVELVTKQDEMSWASRSLSGSDPGTEYLFPVELSTTETGTFTLNWQGLSSFGDDWSFMLIDSKDGNEINLKESENFSFEVSEKEREAARFTLQIIAGTTVSNESSANIPQKVELQQNYPNPFNPSTTIAFGMPETGKVTLEVFDVMGRKVATLLNSETKTAGRHSVQFNADRLASGMYIYRLRAGGNVLTKKLTLIK